MRGRPFVGFSLLCFAATLHSEECSIVARESDDYRVARTAMAGHFPVELEDIEYCGVVGFSRLFKAIVDTYQTHEGWSKAGELSCWKLSQHQPGEPYNCDRRILSTHAQSGMRVTSEYDIPLAVIGEAAFGLKHLLSDTDEIQSVDYVPLTCGGTWSMDEHGFTLKLRSTEPGVRRQFLAKKDCSPTPCLWKFEETEPERWVN